MGNYLQKQEARAQRAPSDLSYDLDLTLVMNLVVEQLPVDLGKRHHGSMCHLPPVQIPTVTTVTVLIANHRKVQAV